MSSYAYFRRAIPADINFISRQEANPKNEYIHRWDNATHQQNLTNTQFHYLIAKDSNDKSLGYAILKDNEDGRIEWRRVVIATPGKGVGKAFMKDVLASFKACKEATIWLDVYEDNERARHVYRSLGFKETHKEACPNNTKNTLVFMEYAHMKNCLP